MKTLKQSVLATYDYQQTKKLCLDYPTVLDCDWELWRDKAQADFGVSKRFFDLVTTLPGYERYLQIFAYFGINEDCVVKVYSDGEIEGVYENYLAKSVSVKEGDVKMYKFFSSRSKLSSNERNPVWFTILNNGYNIEKYSKKSLQKLIRVGYLPAIEYGSELYRRDPEENAILYPSFVALGDQELVNEFTPIFFGLPKDFVLSKDVPLNDDWDEVPKLNLPQSFITQRIDYHDDILAEVLAACLRSGNIQLADLLNFIYDVRKKTLVYNQPIYSSLDPEGAYIIFRRYVKYFNQFKPNDSFSYFPLLFAEAWLYIYESTYDYLTIFKEELVEQTTINKALPYTLEFVKFAKGNIPFLLSLLPVPVLEQKFLEWQPSLKEEQLFPLTVRLHQSLY